MQTRCWAKICWMNTEIVFTPFWYLLIVKFLFPKEGKFPFLIWQPNYLTLMCLILFSLLSPVAVHGIQVSFSKPESRLYFVQLLSSVCGLVNFFFFIPIEACSWCLLFCLDCLTAYSNTLTYWEVLSSGQFFW